MLSSLDESFRQYLELRQVGYPKNEMPRRFGGRVNPSSVWRATGDDDCRIDLGNAYLIVDTSTAADKYGKKDFLSEAPDAEKTYLSEDGIPIEQQLEQSQGPWLATDMGKMTVCFDSLQV